MIKSSLSPKPKEDKLELSIEELKALRLCACGNYKNGRHAECNCCFLLFSANGKHNEFISDLKRVKTGTLEYSTLFDHLENNLPSRRAVMLKIIIANQIKVSLEDFIFFRKNMERRELRAANRTAKDRCRVGFILGKGTPAYSGFNTA